LSISFTTITVQIECILVVLPFRVSIEYSFTGIPNGFQLI
jgi:hypothetical protein